MKRFLRILKYTLIGFFSVMGLLLVVYFLGPKPAKPAFSVPPES